MTNDSINVITSRVFVKTDSGIEFDHPIDEALLGIRVMGERMRQYMRRNRLAGVLGPLAAAYLVSLQWQHQSHTMLLCWALAIAIGDWTSIAHTTMYLRRPRAVEQADAWRRRQMVLQTLMGVAWGSTALLFHSDERGVLDTALVLVNVTAVGVLCVLPFRRAALAFLVALWFFPAVVFAFNVDPHRVQLALGIVLLVGSLGIYMAEASRQLVAGIVERYRADMLAVALRAAAARMHELATRDELTGTINRRQGMKLLGQWHERRRPAAAGEPGLCVLILDIDHFKAVNDNHGHPAGDQVLRAVCQRLQADLRSQDVLARIGGEEFMVVLPDVSLADGCVMAQRLCDVVAARPVEWQAISLRVTISVGLARVAAAEPVEQALARADRALYEAKRSGRNRLVCTEAA